MQLPPELLSAVSLAIEQAMNQALRHDPGSRAQLHALSGRVVSVVIHDLKLRGDVHLGDDSLHIHCLSGKFDPLENDADVVVTGKLADLSRIALNKQQSLAGTGVEARGDLQLLTDLREIIEHIDIDIADVIATKLGPIPARFFASVFDTIKTSAKHTAETAHTLGARYILEERQVLPTQSEFALFADDCHILRQDLTRIDAHIQALNTAIQTQREKRSSIK